MNIDKGVLDEIIRSLKEHDILSDKEDRTLVEYIAELEPKIADKKPHKQFFEYKKGDKVRVRRPERFRVYDDEPCWHPSMDSLVDGIHEVRDSSEGAGVCIDRDRNGTYWYFHPSWVELVSRASSEEVALAQKLVDAEHKAASLEDLVKGLEGDIKARDRRIVGLMQSLIDTQQALIEALSEE